MKKFSTTLIITTILLTACSAVSKATPTIDPVAFGAAATISALNAKATEVALFTPVPTVTPSPTPTEMPVFATALQNVVCRLGPYTNFDQVEIINAGLTAEIIGQMDTNGIWWKVKPASGNECWLFSDLVTVSGNTSKVAFVNSPPTPTPAPTLTWDGQWTILFPAPGSDIGSTSTSTATISQNMIQLSGHIYSAWMELQLSGQLNPSTQTEAWINLKNVIEFQAVLYMDQNNTNQFRGHYDFRGGTYPLCGSRNGSPLPSPCMQ